MKNKSVRIVSAVIGILVVAIGLYGLTTVFRVRYIRVIGSDIRLKIDERLFPTNLIFFPNTWLTKQLLAQYPQVSSVGIRKIYPDTLELTIERRPAVAQLSIGGVKRFVDEYGFPAVQSKDRLLPLVIFPIEDNTLPYGKTLLSTALGAAKYITSVPVEQITKNDNRSIRLKTRETDILIAQEGDFSTIDHTLQSLIAGVRMKGLQPKVIDLRFDKPIITN